MAGYGSKATPGIQVQGARQLRRSLRAAGDDLADLKQAHADAADIAARASSDLAPVRSGALKRTIRSSGTKTAGIVRSGTKRVPYAGPIHWGWFKRGIRPSLFISRGTQNSEGRWLPIYQQALDGAIEKVEGA